MPDDARWAEIARRWRAGEPIAHLMDEEQRAAEEAFRGFLADKGPAGVEALRRYDARVRDVETGVYGARMAWHSSSPAQRRALLFLAPGRVLVRCAWSPNFYDAVRVMGDWPGVSTIAKAARLDTVRNLASRELVSWEGGAFNPEARAAITERAVFVLKHGRNAAKET